jgi:hypothetical protein
MEPRERQERQTRQLDRGQGAGAALQGLQEGVALAGLAFTGFHVVHANAKAFACGKHWLDGEATDKLSSPPPRSKLSKPERSSRKRWSGKYSHQTLQLFAGKIISSY